MENEMKMVNDDSKVQREGRSGKRPALQNKGGGEERPGSSFWMGYLRFHRRGIFRFLLFCLIFLCVFCLYHLPAGAALYPTLLCGVLGICFLIRDAGKEWKKHCQLQEMAGLPGELMEEFPEAGSPVEEDYQEIVELLRREQLQTKNQMNQRYEDMMEYYTTWVHQIKTPIASMHLTLEKEDSPVSRQLSVELERIEQYVEMVLCYLRLDSDTTDYVFGEYELDQIVRQAVKKYAGQFIHRKLRLNYEPIHLKVTTDEKWMLFVLEQVISNALKYTPRGSVTIELEEPFTLCIRDTGIGIAPEDLPRIFEKGYTGCNGREDKKASGLGLYLCRRICQNLGHTITVDSVPDRGTTLRIGFDQKKVQGE